MVSVQDFLKAFSQQWNADQKRKGKALRDAYQEDKTTTAYMLGENGEDFPQTFFDRLAKRLGQQALRERQRLDVVYYTTKAHNIEHTPRIRPARLNVIIEHETKEKVEEEMWKLLMWRAPLKVLVFYDRQAPWLDAKLRQLDALRQEVNREWPEADDTSYLFLIGRPPQRGALPVWWCCDSSNNELRPLRPQTRKFRQAISLGES